MKLLIEKTYTMWPTLLFHVMGSWELCITDSVKSLFHSVFEILKIYNVAFYNIANSR